MQMPQRKSNVRRSELAMMQEQQPSVAPEVMGGGEEGRQILQRGGEADITYKGVEADITYKGVEGRYHILVVSLEYSVVCVQVFQMLTIVFL